MGCNHELERQTRQVASELANQPVGRPHDVHVGEELGPKAPLATSPVSISCAGAILELIQMALPISALLLLEHVTNGSRAAGKDREPRLPALCELGDR